ncbi:MAG: hypothetical protein A2521_05490 [Deltaproteobacteria bacterium RIFOXYD12_FULL_57_12]|nr:MAG: hypothetical protein A2521_05490 [Deltaproteobacteria bacterium RIFOXYD12_FULL_57_12]
MGNKVKVLPKITEKMVEILGMALLCLLLIAPLSFAADPIVEGLKKYPVSVRGENLDVPLLFRAIARQAGITIYVADNITDKISIEMNGRTLYDVFRLIVEAKRLRYFEKDGFIFIQKEEDFRSGTINVGTERLCAKFGRAGDHLEQLTPLLSKSGSITVADRGNCLIVIDLQEHLDKVKNMLGELDKPVPQVYIEARIVVVSEEAKRRLGVKWGFSDQYSDGLGKITADSAIDLSVKNNANLVVGYLRKNLDLNLELQALQEDKLAHILSSPRILVLDGKEAEIKQGKEIAYVTQTDNTINTSFREANLGLKVTPKVLKNRYVVLELAVTNDSVSSTATGNQPTIDTQEISSTLFLEDKQTVVIGGILLQNKDNTKQRVPLLADIPLLGNLFKNKDDASTRYELQVFITPTIVSMANDTPATPVAEVAAPAPAAAPLAAPAEKTVPPAAPSAATESNAEKSKETVPPAPAAAPPPTPETAPAVAKKTATPEKKFYYTVQVAGFRDKANANKLLGQLRSKGYTPFIAEQTSKKGQISYAVRLGTYEGWSVASKVAAEFDKNWAKPSALVLPTDGP